MRQVRIVSDGVTNGSRITNSDTGEMIHGVTGIRINMQLNNVVEAEIEIGVVALDVKAKAEYYVSHPKSGEFKKIKRIEFEDDEVVEL